MLPIDGTDPVTRIMRVVDISLSMDAINVIIKLNDVENYSNDEWICDHDSRIIERTTAPSYRNNKRASMMTAMQYGDTLRTFVTRWQPSSLSALERAHQLLVHHRVLLCDTIMIHTVCLPLVLAQLIRAFCC